MNPVSFACRILPLAVAMAFPLLAHGADCADRFTSTQFDYLGRSADSSKSYWLTLSNRADSFRVSAPGVASIDTWQSTGPSTHITESDVIKNDVNGIHKLDRMKADGSFDCFLQSHGQTSPLLPPTWRPPAKPERPIAIRPELPDRPIAIRPELPERPIAIRPELPDRPIVIRPELPDRPVISRPGTIQIAMNGLTYELSQRQLQDYCPAIQIDEQNNIDEASLQSCTALVSELNRAPLTPGRDLLRPSEWNAWADLQYQHSENRRGFSPIDGKGSTLSLGADRLVNPEFSLGVMLTASDQDANTFTGKMTTESDSMMVGPYFAFGFNPNWSLFGNVMAGRTSKDYRLLTLSGDNSVTKYSAALNLEGNYAIAAASFIRPKLGVSYNYEAGSTYQLSGALLGKQLQIVVDGHSHEAGQMQASTEFNTRLESPQGHVIVPYFEAGLLYNFLQPSQSLDPDWQGMLRAGLRTVAGKSLQIDVNASYQSIGVSNLNVWNCTLFVAYAF